MQYFQSIGDENNGNLTEKQLRELTCEQQAAILGFILKTQTIYSSFEVSSKNLLIFEYLKIEILLALQQNRKDIQHVA